MMKYDFELDLVNTNSLSIIIEQIKSNTTILEFGPATGRLTRYLKEHLDCKVYLVELDEEAGKQALQYGQDLVAGDIENYEWLIRYQDIRFDYLIFADVLEHLRNPEEVLIRAKHLMKPEGMIVLSVPNLAHNSVLIELLNNRFEYTSVGLLDNTHIHMFTKESLENMLQRTGLRVSARYATYSKVGANEISNSVDDVIGIDRSFWLNRDYGEVYQFVYVVKNGMEFNQEESSFLVRGNKNYYAQLFIGNGEAREENSIKKYLDNLERVQKIEYSQIVCGDTIRLDPLNAPCIVEVKQALRRDQNAVSQLKLKYTNAYFYCNNIFWFDTEDPIIEYVADFDENAAATFEFVLKYIFYDGKKIKQLCQLFEPQKMNERIEVLESRLRERERELDEKTQELDEKTQELDEKIQKLNEKTQELDEKSQELENLQNVNQEILAISQKKEELLKQILNSKRWKLFDLFSLHK